MFGRKDNNIALDVKGNAAKFVFKIGVRSQNGDVNFALNKFVPQISGRHLVHRKLEPVVSASKVGEKPRQPHMADRRKDAKPDWHLLKQPEVLSKNSCGICFIRDLLKMREHRPAKITYKDAFAVPVKHRRSQFCLKRFDAFGQGWLGHVAFIGRSGEI